MDFNSLIKSASSHHASGKLSECKRTCLQALQIEPKSAQAKLLLGITEIKLGSLADGILLLEEVRNLDSESFLASLWLSIGHLKAGDQQGAIDAAEDAVRKNPNEPQGLAQLGAAYLEIRLLPEAQKQFEKASRIAPGIVQIESSLAHCLELQGLREESQKVLGKLLQAIQLPEAALVRIGQTLLQQEFAEGAFAFASLAAQRHPQSYPPKILLAQSLLRLNRSEEAADLLRSIKSERPDYSELDVLLGTALQSLGEIDEASQLFSEAQSEDPRQPFPYYSFIFNRRMNESDRYLVEKLDQLEDEPNLSPKQRSYLEYGLGKAYEDLGEYDRSMAHYVEANRIEVELKFHRRFFDTQEFEARTSRTIRTFSQAFLARDSRTGSTSELPILVVGMMRSGTTLMEQILSRHPQVGAAGEQSFWPNNWRQVLGETGDRSNPAEAKTVGDRYWQLLSAIAPGTERVVDKMPGNVFGLGPIHLALPNARIVHMRRNPIDTCISIYATPNRAAIEWAHVPKNIVFVYKQYLRLVDHWREALPADRYLEVNYEDLTADTEAETRRIISFLGLPWSDDCLSQNNKLGGVYTPSVWQVRQPIYRTSTERWRKFENCLGEFSQLRSDREVAVR